MEQPFPVSRKHTKTQSSAVMVLGSKLPLSVTNPINLVSKLRPLDISNNNYIFLLRPLSRGVSHITLSPTGCKINAWVYLFWGKHI